VNERGGWLTYCAIGRLGPIPVVGREVMESAEDVLAGDIREGGWRVRTRDESGGGGGRGHGYLAGTGRLWTGARGYKSIGKTYCPGEEGVNRHVTVTDRDIGSLLYTKGGTDRPIVIVSAHPNPSLNTIPSR